MALNEIHPESSSLPSTFVPAEQEGLYNDQNVFRNHQQRPHSSHHPLEEQNRRSTALTEVELQSMTNQSLQVSLHAGAGSSTDSSHQNRETNGARGTSEHIERHHDAYEQHPAPQYSSAMKKWKRRALVTLSKITALLVLAIVIAGIFAVPVTLFILKANDSGTEGRCRGEVYSGEICRSVLSTRQSCIPGRGNSSEILVALPESQQAVVEQELAQLFLLVQTRPECGDDLREFFCLEAFSGLCDQFGVVQRTLRVDCERITTKTCAAEFQLIQPVLQSRGFAVSCDSFPEESSACSITESTFGSGLDPTITSPQPATPQMTITRNCSDGFFVSEASDSGLCTPECGEWWPQSDSQQRVFDATYLAAGALGLFLSLVVVLLSCIYYKTMFQFPGIFIFYQMLSSLVYVVIFLLNYVDFKALFCQSRDLVESLMPGNETPFCIISAAAWIYISSQVALWWIFHLSMIFCAVFWPFKYHYWRQSGYLKYTHVTMVLTALLLPLVPVIICLKVDGYVLYTLIQPMCVARNSQAAFYSHVLPLLAAVAFGLYLLILIFWKFFSEECRTNRRKVSVKRQVEVKILLLLLCYIFVWTDALGVTVATLIEARDYRNTLVEYFTCEASGTEECPRGTFRQFDIFSKLIASFLIALYPGIFLIYFVKQCKCKRSPDISISGTSESVLSRNV